MDADGTGIKDPAEVLSKEEHDTRVKREVLKRIRRVDTGRYEVELPWKISESNWLLPVGREIWRRKTEGVQQRLNKMTLSDAYVEVFRTWFAECIISRILGNS